MKNSTLTLVFSCLFLFILQINSQTLRTGSSTFFSKVNGANWTLPANQDTLTTNVIITRANSRGLFNIVIETEAVQGTTTPSPLDTEWAVGTLANYNTLTYDTFINAVNISPPTSIGVNLVLHLITDDIYMDIRLDSWTSGGNGGGFSYTRSTPSTAEISDLNNYNFTYYPNPVDDFLNFEANQNITNISIYNMLGQLVKTTSPSLSSFYLDVTKLKSGTYFVKVVISDAIDTFKFIKK